MDITPRILNFAPEEGTPGTNCIGSWFATRTGFDALTKRTICTPAGYGTPTPR